MGHPLVTVFLTSYNHEQYLRESIDSILAQTFSDFELVISDDASTDGSWEIISSYDDRRIIKKRRAHNLNRQLFYDEIESYRGKYVAIAHSDDVWEPKKLEKQVAFMEAHPEYAACFTLVSFIDEESLAYVPQEGHFYRDVFNKENRSRTEWLHYFFYQGNCLCHPSVLIRREKYTAYRLLDFGGLFQVPDFFMWVKLCLHEAIYIYQEPLTKFRLRKGGQFQTSGDRPDTTIRSQYELTCVLRLYRQIECREQMLTVFPEAKEYLSKEKGNCLFALAQIAQSVGHPAYQLLALEIMHDLMADTKSVTELERIYHYTHHEFKKFTGECDVFRTDLLLCYVPICVYADYGQGFVLIERKSRVYVHGDGGVVCSFSLPVPQGKAIRKVRLEIQTYRFKQICFRTAIIGTQLVSCVPENAMEIKTDFDVFALECPQYVIDYPIQKTDLLQVQGRINREQTVITDEVVFECRDYKFRYQALKKEIDSLKKERECLVKELEAIKNTRGYRVLEKIRQVWKK